MMENMDGFCAVMRKVFYMALVALFWGCQDASRVFVGRETMLDKIRGGWAGQVIGCTLGGPTEFGYQGRMIPDSVSLPWYDRYCLDVFNNRPGLYDDVYMDLTFLEVMLKEGLLAPASSYADRFARASYELWHANQTGRWNILNGLMPPLSGHWKHNPHADDIDFQIESDFIGMITPGMPEMAMALSDTIGHVMNYGDGWYGGVFTSAMYTKAYFSSDIPEIVSSALKSLPRESLYYQAIEDVLNFWKANPQDWKACWQMAQERHNDDLGCPDGMLADFNIDARINGVYTVIGLLYGNGDFERTMEIATRCGQDSDCNPATAAGVLGVVMGYDALPEKFTRGVELCKDVVFPYTSLTLGGVNDSTLRLMEEAILSGGGRILEDGYEIVLQDYAPARMEKSFEGLIQGERISINKTVTDEFEMDFSGNGYVLSGSINRDSSATTSDYVARVRVQVDGQKAETFDMPFDFITRKNEVSFAYDLGEGTHHLKLSILNPDPGYYLSLGGMVTYRSK